MEGLCPCGHEPAGSIVPVSYDSVENGVLRRAPTEFPACRGAGNCQTSACSCRDSAVMELFKHFYKFHFKDFCMF